MRQKCEREKGIVVLVQARAETQSHPEMLLNLPVCQFQRNVETIVPTSEFVMRIK